MANPAEPISGQICWPSPGSFTGHQRALLVAVHGQKQLAIDTLTPSGTLLTRMVMVSPVLKTSGVILPVKSLIGGSYANLVVLLDLQATSHRSGGEQGLLTLMSAVLVAGLLALAAPALEGLFDQAIEKVGQ
ncbi:hypothetical protein AYX22_13835 [Arthrobacter sp. D5-1]|nr:hypothetical protein AYX22_13835 [Arthrobacter sp. D5-1]